MTIDAATLILTVTAIYFGIGAFIAVPLGFFCLGFGGRIGWEPFAMFFAWPFFIAARVPGLGLTVIGLMAAGSMVWIVWLALPLFGLSR